jgi:hypothetical protein
MITKEKSRKIARKYDKLLDKEQSRHEKAIEKIYTRKGRELTKAVKGKR